MRMRNPKMIFLLILIAVGVCADGKERKSSDTYKTIRINPQKQSIYLEYVKTGTCFNGNYFTTLQVGPCERKSELDQEFVAVWLRFVNNTRWAVSLEIRKSAPQFERGIIISNKSAATAADSGTDWDIYYKVDSETGCDFHSEAPKDDICKRRETPIPDNPRPPMSGTIFVRSGESVIFAVRREHLKKYLFITTFFRYEWEYADSIHSSIEMPKHSVDFSWWDLDSSLTKEKQTSSKAPSK
jgi:hypothetical protein